MKKKSDADQNIKNLSTPIADFVRSYAEKKITRFHMPGHKGHAFMGCEPYDLTEVAGADSLYEADGIIAESEQNTANLFGTGKTVYSTEGSSQCIRAMLYLAVNYFSTEYKFSVNKEFSIENEYSTANGFHVSSRPYVIAARNVHKAFLYAAALLDLDVVWLWPEEMHSLCSCRISPEQLESELKKHIQPPVAVYVTSPDYLGGQVDIKSFAEICHRHHTILAVDNAHGSYLHFLENKIHPIDLGADICSDSAHKTLPVLTGGAYLQISNNAPAYFAEYAKQAMALFGSTSPSYLIMTSLDLCNQYLADDYEKKLKHTIERIAQIRKQLKNLGWKVEETEPLKLTVQAPEKSTGYELAEKLRSENIECEYADEEYIVCMITPENTEEDYERLVNAFGGNKQKNTIPAVLQPVKSKQEISIREAIFAKHENISIQNALGRICGAPTVSCPPAIPIVVSGELIDQNAITLFEHYGVETVDVVAK